MNNVSFKGVCVLLLKYYIKFDTRFLTNEKKLNSLNLHSSFIFIEIDCILFSLNLLPTNRHEQDIALGTDFSTQVIMKRIFTTKNRIYVYLAL